MISMALLGSLALQLAAEPAAGDARLQFGLAVILSIVATALLILEFILASGGPLAIAAALTAAAAMIAAFLVSTAAGLLVLILIPLVGVAVVRWGLARLVRTRAVPHAEIRDDAGYHHLAAALGVEVGAVGELVTDAMPSGRARFITRAGTNDIDVRVLGPVLGRGQRVVVIDVHGPAVTVQAAPSVP
jgi:hypothetical protein